MRDDGNWGDGHRLLFVVNESFFFYSHRLAVARAAKKLGFAVHVAAPPDHVWAPRDFTVARLHDEGFVFHPIPLQRRGRNPIADLRTLTALARLYRSLRPHVLHHLTIKPVLYGGIVARLLRVPAVVNAVTGLGHAFSAGDLPARVVRHGVARAYRWSMGNPRCRVIVQNAEDGEVLVAMGAAGADRIRLIRGSGVPLAEFPPVPEPDGPPLVVLPARLIWEKGIAEFVEAARRLKGEGVAARFALLGDVKSNYPRAVPQSAVEAWQAEGIVEWWGRREDMPEVYAQSHVVCLPTTYGEGVPRVLIEAAACGRAVVTSDVAGCNDIVRDGINGLLVPPGDVDALTAALRRLLLDVALRQRLGAGGQRIAAEEFSLEQVVAQTLAVYRELLAPSVDAGR